MNKSKILILYEGEDREKEIFENLISIFFSGINDVIVVQAPAEANIFMLYNKLREDDYETDILEIIRESSHIAGIKLQNYKRNDFSEVYLFFDFDEHANNGMTDNLEAIEEMLTRFDNETENGKLFISYPMVEALRDSKLTYCLTCSGHCFINRSDFGEYKKLSSANPTTSNALKYNYIIWKNLSNFYLNRICCLLKIKNFDFDVHYNYATQFSIFKKQMIEYKKNENCFILSSIPNFLLTYSRKNWNSLIGKRNKPFFDKCIK